MGFCVGLAACIDGWHKTARALICSMHCLQYMLQVLNPSVRSTYCKTLRITLTGVPAFSIADICLEPHGLACLLDVHWQCTFATQEKVGGHMFFVVVLDF